MKNTFKDNSEINIGEILQAQIGCTMVIPKFFKVISKSGSKTVKVRELTNRTTLGDDWQGRCVPGDFFNPTAKIIMGNQWVTGSNPVGSS